MKEKNEKRTQTKKIIGIIIGIILLILILCVILSGAKKTNTAYADYIGIYTFKKTINRTSETNFNDVFQFKSYGFTWTSMYTTSDNSLNYFDSASMTNVAVYNFNTNIWANEEFRYLEILSEPTDILAIDFLEKNKQTFITFTIGTGTFTAEPDMTWYEWTNSSYNPDDSALTCSSKLTRVIDSDEGTYVAYEKDYIIGSNIIVANRNYILVETIEIIEAGVYNGTDNINVTTAFTSETFYFTRTGSPQKYKGMNVTASMLRYTTTENVQYIAYRNKAWTTDSQQINIEEEQILYTQNFYNWFTTNFTKETPTPDPITISSGYYKWIETPTIPEFSDITLNLTFYTTAEMDSAFSAIRIAYSSSTNYQSIYYKESETSNIYVYTNTSQWSNIIYRYLYISNDQTFTDEDEITAGQYILANSSFSNTQFPDDPSLSIALNAGYYYINTSKVQTLLSDSTTKQTLSLSDYKFGIINEINLENSSISWIYTKKLTFNGYKYLESNKVSNIPVISADLISGNDRYSQSIVMPKYSINATSGAWSIISLYLNHYSLIYLPNAIRTVDINSGAANLLTSSSDYYTSLNSFQIWQGGTLNFKDTSNFNSWTYNNSNNPWGAIGTISVYAPSSSIATSTSWNITKPYLYGSTQYLYYSNSYTGDYILARYNNGSYEKTSNNFYLNPTVIPKKIYDAMQMTFNYTVSPPVPNIPDDYWETIDKILDIQIWGIPLTTLLAVGLSGIFIVIILRFFAGG